MESINLHIISAELYCRHNINSITFTRWRVSFVKSDKFALFGKPRDNTVMTLAKGNEFLKKLLGYLTVVHDVEKR